MVRYTFSGEKKKKKSQNIPPDADVHQPPHTPLFLIFSWYFVFSASFISQHKRQYHLKANTPPLTAVKTCDSQNSANYLVAGTHGINLPTGGISSQTF